MTTKQRNFFIVCGAVLVAWYGCGVLTDMERQAAFRHQQGIRAQQRQQPKPKPAAPAAKAPPASQAGAAPPPAASPAAGKGVASVVPQPPSPSADLAGIWRGQAAIEGRGICGLRFELVPKTSNLFTGYSSFTCANRAPLMAAKNRANPKVALLNRMDPDSAILSGTLTNGAIHFVSDKNIGADINGCSVSSFTLTPFGSSQLAAEWQAGECPGGHMLLGKARR